MKKQHLFHLILPALAIAFILLAAFAPNPPAPPKCFHYQAVVRDSAGAVLANHAVSLRVSFAEDAQAAAVYAEKHDAVTDPFGVVVLRLGCGMALSGSFDALDWGAHDYWVKIEIDPDGGNDFLLLSESKLWAVPVALYSENTRDWVNVGDTVLFTQIENLGIGVTDPKYKLSVGGRAAFGSRIYPGLNGTEGNYSLVHFKNGTDIHGGILRASKGDDDTPNAPLSYQAQKHSFENGNIFISNIYPALHFENQNGKAQYWELSTDGEFYLYDPLISEYRLFFHPDGNVGIGKSPERKLDVAGQIQSKSSWPAFHWTREDGTAAFSMDLHPVGGELSIFDQINDGGVIRFQIRPNGPVWVGGNLDVNGTTRTKILEITGGDVAEARHTTAGQKLPAGSVVVFDETRAGKIRLTTQPYDKKVAGVISGAGQYFAGVCLLQEELARGAQPVAQVGTVEVLCIGPVAVGDLLTTSAVAGHAMAVADPVRSIGCTIGKAVTPLKAGERGLVEMQVEKH